MRRKAAELGKKMQKEDGVGKAVFIFSHFWGAQNKNQ